MKSFIFHPKKPVSIMGIVFLLLLFLMATAQAASLEKKILPLAFSPPLNAKELAANAEIILISGYEPADRNRQDATVNVEVHRPGSKVLLILASCQKVHWQVTASPSTKVSCIVAGILGNEATPTITTSISTQGFLLRLPCVYQTENAGFPYLLDKLNGIFAITKVDAFRGSYIIHSSIRVSELDPPGPELTLDGFPSQKSSKNFTFEVLRKDLSIAHWSLTGPAKDEDKSGIEEGRVVVTKHHGLVFRLLRDNLEVFDQQKNTKELVTLPANFPNFSHPCALAYDSKRDIMSVATYGGKGYLYRYDVTKKQWIDFQSLNHIDICHLSYDPLGDHYVAWADRYKLLFITADGHIQSSKDISKKLTGFGRLSVGHGPYGPMPCIKIVPNGNDIALLYIQENAIENIWHYSVDTDTAILTYKNH